MTVTRTKKIIIATALGALVGPASPHVDVLARLGRRSIAAPLVGSGPAMDVTVEAPCDECLICMEDLSGDNVQELSSAYQQALLGAKGIEACTCNKPICFACNEAYADEAGSGYFKDGCPHCRKSRPLVRDPAQMELAADCFTRRVHVGDTVYGKWRANGMKQNRDGTQQTRVAYFRGTVEAENADGTFKLKYFDGDTEESVDRPRIAFAHKLDAYNELRAGDEVLARKRKVKDGVLQWGTVVFQDGEKEVEVARGQHQKVPTYLIQFEQRKNQDGEPVVDARDEEAIPAHMIMRPGFSEENMQERMR